MTSACRQCPREQPQTTTYREARDARGIGGSAWGAGQSWALCRPTRTFLAAHRLCHPPSALRRTCELLTPAGPLLTGYVVCPRDREGGRETSTGQYSCGCSALPQVWLSDADLSPSSPSFPGSPAPSAGSRRGLGQQSPPTPPRQAGAVTSRDFAATSLQPLSWHRPWSHASPGQQGLPPFHPQGRACPLEPRLPEECLQEARRAWSRLPSSASHHLLMGLRLRGRWEPNSKGSRWFCSHR